MEKVILVTGTPGSGKTTVAHGIAKYFGYEYILIGEHKEYIVGLEGGVKIVDVDKMIKWIKEKQNNSEKTLVIDSHISHHYPKELTRICFVIRCDPLELKGRLVERGYSKEKIDTNLEAEAMDLILQEAIMEGHVIHEINTTHKQDKTSAWEAIKVLEGSLKPHYGDLDFSYYLTK